MTKKSISEFIAALRKANGMTQKQLAEILNVSDKAISRWERDESAPDISLIPVIADVFGVTCDEILRGEKRTSNTEFSKPSQKQLDYLLNKTKTNFNIRCYISCGIGVLALLFAILINFAFSKSFIAFIVGCIFLLVAIVIEIISILNSLGTIETKELEEYIVFPLRSSLYTISKRVFTFLGIILGILFPLLIYYLRVNLYRNDSGYLIDFGIRLSSWIQTSIICVGIITIIRMILYLILDKNFQNKYVEYLAKDTIEYNTHMRKLTIKMIIVTIAVFALTYTSRILFFKLTDAFTFIKGTTFTNIQEFEDYMDEVSYNYIHMSEYFDNNQYNEYAKNVLNGNIKDQDGNVISTFNYQNKKVIGLKVEWKDSNPVITTFTINDLMDSQMKIDNILFNWRYTYYIEMLIIICIFVIKYYQYKKHFL